MMHDPLLWRYRSSLLSTWDQEKIDLLIHEGLTPKCAVLKHYLAHRNYNSINGFKVAIETDNYPVLRECAKSWVIVCHGWVDLTRYHMKLMKEERWGIIKFLLEHNVCGSGDFYIVITQLALMGYEDLVLHAIEHTTYHAYRLPIHHETIGGFIPLLQKLIMLGDMTTTF